MLNAQERAALRELCDQHGVTRWDALLNYADAVEKEKIVMWEHHLLTSRISNYRPNKDRLRLAEEDASFWHDAVEALAE